VPLVAAVLPLSAISCTPSPSPESVAAQEVAAANADAARSAAEEAQRRADEASKKPVREKMVVIQEGGSQHTPTPGELAAAAREERRRHGDRSVGELTDKNLAEVASQGTLTYATVAADADASTGEQAPGREGGAEGTEVPEAGAPAESGPTAAAAADVGAADAECGETCWRRRARELRRAWSEAAGEIEELEAEVADLRWRFYATDDPYQRDSQIKPAWDRAIDRLRRTREEAERYRERVGELMEEGRRSGALPGWLREGVELEPEGESQEESTDPTEPIEPPLTDQDAVEPGR
jgi:hypothetical protein